MVSHGGFKVGQDKNRTGWDIYVCPESEKLTDPKVCDILTVLRGVGDVGAYMVWWLFKRGLRWIRQVV